MKSVFRLFGLLCLLLTLFACGNPRKGALSPESRTELDQFAEANISIEKKYLKLANKIVDLLDEAAALPDEAAAMELIRKFASDNDMAIQRIAAEFEGWQKHVNHDDQMDFVALLVQQPYGKKLKVLVPAFRNRLKARDNPGWLAEYDAFVGTLAIHR
jgi:predicted small lipoprotein YifL